MSCKSCLAGYVKIAAGISLALGLAALIYAIVVHENYAENLLLVGELETMRKGLLYILMVAGILLILTGVFGLFGAYKNNTCCTKCFNWTNAFFFVVFMLLAILCVVILRFVLDDLNVINILQFEKDSENCKDNYWVGDVDGLAVRAEAMLCSNSCPCRNPGSYIDDDSLDIDDDDGAKKVQDCEKYDDVVDDFGDFGRFFELLEEDYKCAGFCKGSDYYLFTDITEGKPENSEGCASELHDYLQEHGYVYAYICFAICFILLMNTLCSCCLYKKQEESKEKETELQAKYKGYQIPQGQNRA